MARALDPDSPEALYGTMFVEICKLSPRERHTILDVMLRDEILRQKDEQRVLRMKGELQELRRRGAIRTSECSLADAGVRSCGRCRAALGWIVNRGAVCQACRKRVCKACREYTVRTVEWVCTVCYKRTQLQTATGEWMNEFIKKPRQWKDSKIYMSPAEIIKSTIRRSWTICDPNPRWASSRDSPEFRPYNSLPRGRDVTDYPSLIAQRSVQTSKQSLENTDESTEKIFNTENQEGYSPRHRRVSQFERTLSELYGSQKKGARKMSTSEENGIDKLSTEDDNNSSTSSNNGNTEIKIIPKPSKIPSPRKKLQYTRSETLAGPTNKHQQVRKQHSLQPGKKSKDKSLDDRVLHEKHVSFDCDSTKKLFDGNENSVSCVREVIKSGIPKRDGKARASKNDLRGNIHDKDARENEALLVGKSKEIVDVHAECDMNNLSRSEDETSTVGVKSEAEPVSGAVFRKVTIKKRRQDFKKTQAFDEGRRKHRCSESEFIDVETGRILLPEGDDYKLVFLSSDSSSKEEDVDDNDSVSSSSATTAHSFTIDDCDWDYFEPSSGVRPVLCWSNRNSPYGSPSVYRRSVVLDSPLGSPLVYRRTRESDTGTDEDVTNRGADSGSPVSSDSTTGFLSRIRSPSDTEDHLAMDATSIYVDHQSKHQQQRLQYVMHRVDESPSCVGSAANSSSEGNGGTGTTHVGSPSPCQSCGAIAATSSPTTQFVPIPVLVPIPVPVPAIWNPLDSVILYNTSDSLDATLRARLRAIQQRSSALFWPYVNQASLISSLISAGAGDANTFLSVQHSVYTTAPETSMPAASDRNNTTSPTTESAAAATAVCATNELGSNADNKPRVSTSPVSEEVKNAAPKRETVIDGGESNRTDDPILICSTGRAGENGAVQLVNEEIIIGGYLLSETTYMSSSESSISDSDLDNDNVDRPVRVRRSYNVSGGNMRESDDALPNSDASSDCDDDDDDEDTECESSGNYEGNDDLSSSGSAETDSDDTGTVADQPKKFSKIFIVNTIDSSSDIEDNSASSDTDTSDNDTDTEKDCLILNYESHTVDNNVIDNSEQPVVLLKHIGISENYCEVQDDDENNSECSSDNNVILLKHVLLEENEKETNFVAHLNKNTTCDSNLTCAKSISLSLNDSSNTDKNNIIIVPNESETSAMIETEYISFDHLNYVNSDTDKKEQASKNSSSNEFVLNSDPLEHKTADTDLDDYNCKLAPLSAATLRNTELIGDRGAPTALDCIARVSEENKQTTNDLETPHAERAPSPSDKMKANDPQPNAAGDGTPLKTTANECTDNCEREDVYSANKSDFNLEGKQDELLIDSEKSEVLSVNGGSGSEWNTSVGIRSGDPVRQAADGGEGEEAGGTTVCSARGARTGAPTAVDNETARHVPVPAARYTSLVMITQEPPAPAPRTTNVYPQVSVVPSDTTTIVPVATPANGDVIVQHTNWQRAETSTMTQDTSEDTYADNSSGLAGYFALALDREPKQRVGTPRKAVLVTNKAAINNDTVLANSDPIGDECDVNATNGVTVVTGGDTLSAVVCLEEGLADDDSWVEDISHDEDEFATTTATDSSSGEEVTLSCTVVDQEEELRGYHRCAIDFTLHTIIEESCEESEVEQSHRNNKKRPTSATDLEKYFVFRLGDGTAPNVNEDALSETSSIYSEGMDSLGANDGPNNDGADPAELASSRLEKYFLSGFMGFTTERRDSDGSVGSDSEGRPSPEQRRKKLVRARGTGRSHSSSLDNLLANAELSGTEQQVNDVQLIISEDSSSSETETYDESISNFEKSDGQFDTVKRKKCKKQRVTSGGSSSPHEEKKCLETTMEESNENKSSDDDDDGHKTPQPEFLLPMSSDLANSRKQQSRDSGFIGSCDDLLKEQKVTNDVVTNLNDNSPLTKQLDLKNDLEKITEEKHTIDEKQDKLHNSIPPATTLTRKDSFNNWSSDEETNLMMSKMRQFFKTMVANTGTVPSKPTTPILGMQIPPRPMPSPRAKNRNKPPQLVYFENELTRLMKTVPGIRDDQVREIVEYLSSEDTWSDSYDSSDYTSSDLECASVAQKSVLQQQISASCQQIINKFDNKTAEDEEGDEGDGGILDESQGLNRETAFVYQKLVASFNKMTSGDGANGTINSETSPNNSPPLIAKVMHHIGSRLVALMHEVSSGESHSSTSPKVRYHHRRLQQKLSSASTTTTEDDDSTSDSNLPDHLTGLDDMPGLSILPRSKSHDLLLGEVRAHHHSSSGVSDIAEEKEASDYERFSWRGSFESALMATDSRTKLSMIGSEGSASASALAMAAKRRSAGDLLFSPKSLSREQLDRVRSCGSIGGGGNSDDKHWVVTSSVRPNRRRSSVPDATCGSGGSADGEDDDDEDLEGRSTLPRSLQTNTNTTNSLPRLPTSSNAANMHKAQSMHHFLQHNVKSARYRPPGFSRSSVVAGPKRAVSAPGLQPSHPRRETRRRSQHAPVASDDVSTTESNSSPIVCPRNASKSASPSPIHGNTFTRGTGSVSSADWPGNDDDIDRLVAMHHNRNSLSSLGLRSDSMASVYSGAGEGRYGIVAVRGQVEFGLQYNYKAGALEINIKQCKDLAAVDAKRNRSDPYVKVYLLPDKSKSGKRKTKVKKHTLNPVFDENLKFHLSLSGLETRTLWLTVWHSDMFGRNDFLGEVMMPLENKVFDDPTPKWYNLQERTEPFEELPSYKGDVIVGLKFVPPDMTVHKKGKRSRGALHVLVKEAKSLTAVKANGTSDPFCKSYLLPDKGRSYKQKTPILRRTTNPVWNHTFVYDDVTLQELAERALELTVWDHDRLASNEFLGGVRFSLGTNKHYGKSVDWMDSTGKELSLWQSMLERPNFWVEGCVSLRPSLDNRSS